MRVSVILATYNGEKNIEEQLESIRNQTYPIDEVLIHDDNSMDRTFELVNKYINKYSLINWKCSKNNQNIGWKVNFKKLLDEANGDIIFLCDQDDIWNPDKIKKMVNAFKENDDIQLLMCGYTPYYESSRVKKISRKALYNMKENNTISQQKLDTNFLYVLKPGCTYAVKKELVDLCKQLWTEDFAHDELLWKVSIILDKAYNLNTSLIEWRRLETSATSELSTSSYLKRAKTKYYERLSEIKRNINFLKSIEINDSLVDNISVYNKKILSRVLKVYRCWNDCFENKKIVKSLILSISTYKYRYSFIHSFYDFIVICIVKFYR